MREDSTKKGADKKKSISASAYVIMGLYYYSVFKVLPIYQEVLLDLFNYEMGCFFGEGVSGNK